METVKRLSQVLFAVILGLLALVGVKVVITMVMISIQMSQQ